MTHVQSYTSKNGERRNALGDRTDMYEDGNKKNTKRHTAQEEAISANRQSKNRTYGARNEGEHKTNR